MTVVVDASVAWRKSRCCEVSPDQAKAMIQGLPSLFDHLTPYGELAERALEIAVLIGHPVYDCIYLALAERHRTHMVTADQKLLVRLSGTAWLGLAIGLSQLPPIPALPPPEPPAPGAASRSRPSRPGS